MVIKKCCQTFMDSLGTHDQTIYEILALASAKQPSTKVMECCPDLVYTIKRLSTWILWSPTEGKEVALNFISILNGHGVTDGGAVGALCEALLSGLDGNEYKLEVAEVAMALGEKLLIVYSAKEYPLRRLR
jgi:hypothetical protein